MVLVLCQKCLTFLQKMFKNYKNVLCYNRFMTKKYKKRKPTDIIRFVKKIKISKEAFL